MKTLQSTIAVLFLFAGINVFGQIVDENAYIIGERVEVAIDGNGGHEGTADWPGHHSRGGSDEVPYGFVANPTGDWSEYDGDFFTAGTPENGFGLEINGVNYSNNGWDDAGATFYLSEIPTAPGSNITHTVEDDCIIVEWEGQVAGVTINVKYRLVSDALYYTTEVTLYNGSGSDITDLFYYRNIDPDNNESIGATFETTNTIVSQPDPDCIKALVSAEQGFPWPSYIGLGALGEDFRVTHGGFSNRDGSDIWNAAGGLNGTVGDVAFGDEAISLAYKTNLNAGETVNFSYVIVLHEAAVEAALSSLYYIKYDAIGGAGGGTTSECAPEIVIVNSCRGDTILLSIHGPDVDQYDWAWFPTYEENDSTIYVPYGEGPVTVVGDPISPCLVSDINKEVYIAFTEGPLIDITYPDDTTLICGAFNLADMEYVNIGGDATDCVLLTTQPDSATQTEPAFEDSLIGPEDEVWLMCGDSVTGCFDFVLLNFNFIGPNAAGEDTSVTMCGGPGTVVDLSHLISDSANVYGYYYDVDGVGGLDTFDGSWFASNLYGTYTFYYITEGRDTCLGDTAVFTVTLMESPFARFEYAVDGFTSTDGLYATCLSTEVDFTNLMSIPDPGEIVYFVWYFGDGDSSNVMHPSHTYDGIGTYTITLVVWSDNGCKGSYSSTITIYDAPEIDFLYTDPVCNGFEDGLITVTEEYSGNPLIIIIKDEDGNILNEDGSGIADSLGPGTYYMYIEDPSGCVDSSEITLFEPPPMDIYYSIYHPPCTGDSGYVVIDSVVGESPNNPVSYVWDPNPAGIEGITADSSYWMAAGDYTLTATDSKGCTNQISFTLIDPPPFYWTEWGWDTAYCRVYGYQSGNGFVYAAVAGGVPNYTYEWTYLYDGSTSFNTTWGGRNPGDHLITATDAGGCVLTKIITVDSVNPIAAFDVISADLNNELKGTADVAVEYVNQSKYYANPNNPDADTLFLWDMDRTEIDDWIICYDFFETFDTVYEARGETYEVDVCLIAFNKNGCRDTACKRITIWEPPELNPVNIFTPNSDGFNDYLTFENYQKGIDEFHCIIVNRWGVQVGEINDIAGHWDGRDYDGQRCTDGVYFYTYTAVADNGEEFAGQGTVTIVDSPPE